MKKPENLIRLNFCLSLLFVFSCSSKILKYEKASDLKKNEEFTQTVKIEEVGPPVDAEEPPTEESSDQTLKPSSPAGSGSSTTATPPPTSDKKTAKVVAKEPVKNKKPVAPPAKAAKTAGKKNDPAKGITHEPDIEDAGGFEGRRPKIDPFRVGEKIVHKVFYDSAIFNFTAGNLTMRVNPFAQVNGRKAYSLDIFIKSSSFFSSYYSVDDKVRAYMDYEDLVPTTFTLHVKESKQLREAQMYFDFIKNQATYWEKKYTEKNGQEEKKLQWDILPYSQNVFSAAYYMRTFEWKDGKEYAFRVADDNENVVFKGKVVARETLKTDVGTFKAIKIKPEFTVKGVFKPVGDIFIWLSDDDRKFILRIESKIKIGSLVSEISELNKGE